VNALFEMPANEFLEPQTAQKLARYSIEPGDLVMTRKGTVGNCAVYPENFPVGIMHSDLLRLRVSRDKCEPMFLGHQLQNSRDVERQLALISGGAVMPGVNVTKLKALEVTAPPLVLQKEFVQRLATIEKVKSVQRASLAEMDALFATLQHRAFRGEL
jgi:type I restriction enzyme S subunit